MKSLTFTDITEGGDTPVPLFRVIINMDDGLTADREIRDALKIYHDLWGCRPTPQEAAYLHNLTCWNFVFLKSEKIDAFSLQKDAANLKWLINNDTENNEYAISIKTDEEDPPALPGDYVCAYRLSYACRGTYTATRVKADSARGARVKLTWLICQLQECALMARDPSDVMRVRSCMVNK